MEATEMLIKRWIDKDVVCVCVWVCVMEYYSTIKKNDIIPFVAVWMNLEITIWSEVCQTERQIAYDTYHYITYIGIWKKTQLSLQTDWRT